MKIFSKSIFLPYSILLFVLVQTLWFVSCGKDDPAKFDFEIYGVANISSNVGETKSLTLEVFNTGEVLEDVVLNVKNVPKGVTWVFDNSKGKPTYTATLNFAITRDALLGSYSLMIEAISPNSRKLYPFELRIDDELSLSMTVYDATQWTSEATWGALMDGAIVKLYKNESDFITNKPVLIDTTNSKGKVLFYRLEPANYIFVVQKGELSNIAQKKMLNGSLKGYVTAGIFITKSEIYNSSQPKAQPGELKFRDQNADGMIDDNDRMQFDELSIYPNVLNEKVIWIGK